MLPITLFGGATSQGKAYTRLDKVIVIVSDSNSTPSLHPDKSECCPGYAYEAAADRSSRSSSTRPSSRSYHFASSNTAPRIIIGTLLALLILVVGLHIMGDLQAQADIERYSDKGSLDAYPVVFAASHNDEMQPAPFVEALSLGLAAVEVDVWLHGGVILAGHELKDLSPNRTLESIYLAPLLKLLENANIHNESGKGNNETDWRGIFPRAPKQDLILMIDMKGDADALFDALLQALQPFISSNYLTFYQDGKMHPGPLTIIGTGETPLVRVFQSSPRYIFFDAPLVSLAEGFDIDGTHHEYDGAIAPMASSKWLWSSYYPNVPALRKYSDQAHKRGIKARWWGVARWPGYLRRALWNLQLQAHVDWLNADDLADVAAFLRSKNDQSGGAIDISTSARP